MNSEELAIRICCPFEESRELHEYGAPQETCFKWVLHNQVVWLWDQTQMSDYAGKGTETICAAPTVFEGMRWLPPGAEMRNYPEGGWGCVSLYKTNDANESTLVRPSEVIWTRLVWMAKQGMLIMLERD